MIRRIINLIFVATLRLFVYLPGGRPLVEAGISRWRREKPREIEDGVSKSQIGLPVELASRRHYNKRQDVDIRSGVDYSDEKEEYGND